MGHWSGSSGLCTFRLRYGRSGRDALGHWGGALLRPLVEAKAGTGNYYGKRSAFEPASTSRWRLDGRRQLGLETGPCRRVVGHLKLLETLP